MLGHKGCNDQYYIGFKNFNIYFSSMIKLLFTVNTSTVKTYLEDFIYITMI